MRSLLKFCFAICLPMAAFAREDIALTFDDLPALTILKSQAYVNYANETILRGLKRHHFPAIGFVNEGKFDDLVRAEQIEVLKKWLDAGMDLGNHTYSHSTPNQISAIGYIEDVERGEHVTRPLLAEHRKELRWFRHPYLETGVPAAEKEQIDHWLATHGYRIAPVTMENSDWMFAEPYDDAIARHDAGRVAHIRQSYLEYTEKMVIWHQEAAHQLLGRPFSHVMLLHSTRLNADCFEDLAAILKRRHLHPVTLEKAMKDPAYRIHDPYVGPEGVEWLERWSQELHKDLPWDTYSAPPEDIHAEYQRVDGDGR
jgi:peptidoglycan/xylan/chitin deacetylase (PgdA/CDA1 family)